MYPTAAKGFVTRHLSGQRFLSLVFNFQVFEGVDVRVSHLLS